MKAKKEKAAPGKATAKNTFQLSCYQPSAVVSSQNALEKAGLWLLGIAGGKISSQPHVWQRIEDALRQHYRCDMDQRREGTL